MRRRRGPCLTPRPGRRMTAEAQAFWRRGCLLGTAGTLLLGTAIAGLLWWLVGK